MSAVGLVHRRRHPCQLLEDGSERAEILRQRRVTGLASKDLSGADRNRSGQLQLVYSDCNNAFLISPVPIRERTAVNTNGNGAVCFAYRVRPKVGDGPLRRCLFFLRRALSEAITVIAYLARSERMTVMM